MRVSINGREYDSSPIRWAPITGAVLGVAVGAGTTLFGIFVCMLIFPPLLVIVIPGAWIVGIGTFLIMRSGNCPNCSSASVFATQCVCRTCSHRLMRYGDRLVDLGR